MPIRAAMLHMIVSRLIGLAVMAVSFAVLGRLLTPAVFGHFALAMAIFSVAQGIAGFGLKQYLIRAETVDPAEVRSATATGIGFAVIAALACLALAYGLSGTLLPEQAALALVPLTGALVVNTLSLGTEAMLHRELDFRLVAVVEVLRIAVDGGVAIGLALAGFGAVALSCGVLVSHTAATVLILALAGAGRRVLPGRGPWRDFLPFGGRLVTIQTLPTLCDLAVASSVSALAGAATLGLLNRAQTINKMLDRVLLEGIAPVVLPALRASLVGGASPLAVYIAKVDYMAVICWPGFALIALMAEPLVLLLLGPEWGEAVPALRILALGGIAMPISKMSLKFFSAIDALSTYLRIQAIQQGLRVGLAAAGAMISLEAVCAALSATLILKAGALVVEVRRRYGHGGYREVFLRAAAVTLATLAGPAALLTLGAAPVVTLALALVTGAAGWLIAVVLVRHRLAGDLREVALDLPGRVAPFLRRT